MKEATTDFSYSFDYLAFKVGDVVAFMTRDIAEFTSRGVTQLDIDAFETQGNDFENLLPDEYYRGMVTDAVQAKNAAKDSCAIQARKIAGIAEQVFGNKSGKYKAFGYSSLRNATERSFITSMRLIAKTAETFIADLTGAGLTQAMIDALVAEAQVMEDKLHEVAVREAERDAATNTRVLDANALNANLVKYCQIGKSIWEDVNEAYYNDYVINPTIHHGLSKVQNLDVSLGVPNPYNATLQWDPVAEATEYELHISEVNTGNPAGEFSLAGTYTDTNIVYAMNPGRTYYFKVRGKNSSTMGYFSDVKFLDAP